MSITYEWKIDSLETAPEINGEANVVVGVNWRLFGVQNVGDYSRHTNIFGATGLTYEQGMPFTAYESLTKEQVTEWVKETIGAERVAAYEAHIADVLSAMRPQQLVSSPLPWAR